MALSHSPRIVTDNLVLCLDAGNTKSYNAGISTTTWTDLSGRGNTGTLTNGPTYSSVNGGSIVFDGTNDYVEGTFSTALNNSYYSVDWWIYPTLLANFNQVLTFQVGIWDNFQLHTSSTGGIYAGTKLSGRLTPSSSGMPTMTLNTWQNFTFVNNNGFVDLYKDGIKYISAHNNGISATSTTIYYTGKLSGEFVKGNLAALKVYNGKALTADEVSQNFNALRGRFGI